MKYLIALPLVLLASCATALPTRVSTTDTPVHIEFVSDIRSKCGAMFPTASACVINGQIYIDGRDEISGNFDRTLSVRYVDYNQLGNECGRLTGGPACWDEGGTMVYHDSENGSAASECEAGNMLLKEWGITKQYSPAMGCELGHEVMFHVLGGHRHKDDLDSLSIGRIALEGN